MKMSRKLHDIHEQAIIEFDKIQSALREERYQCLQDRRFYSLSGAQWEGNFGDQFENKPKLEINQIHLSIMRIINEYRNNRITVDFVPKDGAADSKMADTLDGLYRATEQESSANEAYDNAFEEAVGGGFGAWRIRADYEDYEDDENEYQKIVIEPIFDADSSVFFDLNAKRQDKRDATRCFVIVAMERGAYEEKYNDDPASWPKAIHQQEFDWATSDMVYVAELYVKEEYQKVVHIFETIDGQEERYTDDELESDPELISQLESIGTKEVRQKKVESYRVRKYLMNGNTILEDQGYIAGKCIPIVPVYGKRWFIDNVERCMGHVRLAKDMQRITNMLFSKLAEISSLSSVEKPIFFPEQIAAHRLLWEEDNLKNYPFLMIDPIEDVDGNVQITGPVGYTKPPAVPQAMGALFQLVEQYMGSILGKQEAAEELKANTSGVAVELIQQRIDMQVAIYMSNMAKAMKRSGEIWMSMAKDIFVESGRKLKTISREKKPGNVELMRPIVNKETGAIEYENDLSKSKYEIDVSVGPSSGTKRAATVRSLTGMMTLTQDPQTLQVLTSMAMMNLEGEGIEDARQYFRKNLVRMGVVQPTEEEQQELQAEMQAQQQPTPEQQYMEAAAMEAAARAQKAQADTLLTAAKTEQTKADTVSTLAEIDSKQQQQAVDAMKTMSDIQEKNFNQQQIRQNNLQNQENM